MKSNKQNNADRFEKPWTERYRDEYEIPSGELGLGIINDPAKIAEMNRREGIRHTLMAELPKAVKKPNEPQTYPSTIDECKELFEGIIQKNDMLRREDSQDVAAIRNWRAYQYRASERPTLKNGTWGNAAYRLVELALVSASTMEQTVAATKDAEPLVESMPMQVVPAKPIDRAKQDRNDWLLTQRGMDHKPKMSELDLSNALAVACKENGDWVHIEPTTIASALREAHKRKTGNPWPFDGRGRRKLQP